MKNNKTVDALNEELPQIRTEAEKTALSEIRDVIVSGDAEKLKTLPEKFASLSAELQEQVMNATKMTNRTKILEATQTLTEVLGRFPSKLEVAAETKFSLPTVYKHMKELAEQNYWEEELQMLKVQKVKYLNVLAKAGYKDPKCAKMILDLLNTTYIPSESPVVNNYNTAIQFVMTLSKEEQEKFTQRIVEISSKNKKGKKD